MSLRHCNKDVSAIEDDAGMEHPDEWIIDTRKKFKVADEDADGKLDANEYKTFAFPDSASQVGAEVQARPRLKLDPGLKAPPGFKL